MLVNNNVNRIIAMIIAPDNDNRFMEISLQDSGTRSSQEKQPFLILIAWKRDESKLADVPVESDSSSKDLAVSGEDGVVFSAYTLFDVFMNRTMSSFCEP